MSQYLPVLTLFVLAVIFAVLSIIASAILAPKRPNVAKATAYESGIVPRFEPAQRFPVKFYLVAMIFIIFDIEIIFLYPWAVVFDQLQLFGLVEMAVFALAVFVSFLYLISNGALDWGPSKRLRTSPAGSGRTTESTVRRVSRTSAATEVPDVHPDAA